MLMEQVEELTSGAIPGKAMGYSLSLGVAFSLGLAMIRVLKRYPDPGGFWYRGMHWYVILRYSCRSIDGDRI